MLEDRVPLGRNSYASEFGGSGGKVAYFDTADVIEVAGVVSVASDTVCNHADLTWHVTEARQEALPLRRYRGTAFARVALADTNDQQWFAIFETRRIKNGGCVLVHANGLHEFKVVDVALCANLFGCDPKLIAKRPRKCLM